MKGFLTTHKGMENIASLEVKELITTNSKINEACVVFDIKNYEDLFKLCYRSQSSIGVYYLLSEFNHNDIFKEFKKNIEKIKFNEWLNKNTKFRVKCIKISETDISTQEIEKKFGEIIIEHIEKKYNYRQKVDLDNPEIIIFAYLTERLSSHKGKTNLEKMRGNISEHFDKKCYIGIDFSGFNLSKRSYKIFSHSADIKGTIGYFLVRLSGYNKNETLLDTFSASGTIPIEAALFASKFPINYYSKEKFIFLKFQKFRNFDFNRLFKKLDGKISASKLNIYNVDSSMRYLSYSRKNSKIAGVDKKIRFSRNDTEWLDTKFKKGSIDRIVTILPSLQNKESKKIYNEFFYQAEFILNKKGNITLIGNKDIVKQYSAKYKFKICDKANVVSGKKQYQILVLSK